MGSRVRALPPLLTVKGDPSALNPRRQQVLPPRRRCRGAEGRTDARLVGHRAGACGPDASGDHEWRHGLRARRLQARRQRSYRDKRRQRIRKEGGRYVERPDHGVVMFEIPIDSSWLGGDAGEVRGRLA